MNGVANKLRLPRLIHLNQELAFATLLITIFHLLPIEYHINPLERDRGIDDGPLSALLDFDSHLVALVLICNQRRNVGLDAAGTEADDDDRSNVTTERMAMGKRCGKRGSPEDEQANPVNATEQDDGLVAAEVLISNDGTEDWRDCEFY
jgi:hypothetical protein